MASRRTMVTSLALGALMLVGCSSRRAEAEAAPTDQSGMIKAAGPERAREVLERMRVAYEAQDMEAVLAEVDPRYYPDISRLRRSLYEDREQISQIHLEFHINQEMADENNLLQKVRWNRTHTVNATGASARAQGVCEIQFRKRDGKILDIRPMQGGMPVGFN